MPEFGEQREYSREWTSVSQTSEVYFESLSRSVVAENDTVFLVHGRRGQKDPRKLGFPSEHGSS